MIDFKFFVQQKHAPFYENTCSLDELDEKPSLQKFRSLEILNEKVVRQMTHIKNHLIKKLCSMGSKCLALDVGHM
jgi:hypothetical protein